MIVSADTTVRNAALRKRALSPISDISRIAQLFDDLQIESQQGLSKA